MFKGRTRRRLDQLASNTSDSVQDRFVEIDKSSLNSVIDIGGRLVYLQEFIKSCREVAYENYGSRLSASLSNRGISVSPNNLYQITNKEGISAKLLHPGAPLTSGKVRVRLLVEFEPDLSDDKTNLSDSPLDDLRTE